MGIGLGELKMADGSLEKMTFFSWMGVYCGLDGMRYPLFCFFRRLTAGVAELGLLILRS